MSSVEFEVSSRDVLGTDTGSPTKEAPAAPTTQPISTTTTKTGPAQIATSEMDGSATDDEDGSAVTAKPAEPIQRTLTNPNIWDGALKSQAKGKGCCEKLPRSI
ncbi:hypothetical protein AURDEDRAFT_163770 [Auricularia subglabra TFB-10046 SS5]|nr:hypothetical protein AURDEDRAFT_163770 [Auricularia subglabra TFB-10046 SS5]